VCLGFVGTIIAYDCQRLIMRKILNELIRKFSASGWNTLVPYQNRPDRFFLRKRLPSDSALLKSMGMLIDYIEDLSNIKKESTNHDLILKNAIEIKKLDFLPVVPDSYLYVSETVHSRFYYIYQLIISIFKYFMELQDLIYYRNDISQFSDFLKIEQNIVKTLNKIIPEYFNANKFDLGNVHVIQDLSKHYTFLVNELETKMSLTSWERSTEKIHKIFKAIDHSNNRLLRRLLDLENQKSNTKTITRVSS